MATFPVGGGTSLVVGLGGEGSVGIYFSNAPNDIGFFASGGMGAGFSVGGNAQFGYASGALKDFASDNKNYNFSCVVASGTWSTDPKTGKFSGLVVGPAGQLGFSKTNTRTGTLGLRDLFDWVFDTLGGIK